MKEKIISITLLISVAIFSAVNTFILDKAITKTVDDLTNLRLSDDMASEKAQAIYADFQRMQGYMSITVSHDDLTSIEDCFVEMIAYLSVKDVQNAEVIKSRLVSYLKHLRRLSGMNIDAII